jgi:rhodanese-related sulfurtransferase
MICICIASLNFSNFTLFVHLQAAPDMTLPYGTSISAEDYKFKCRMKCHILLDVRSKSQFDIISFRHYSDVWNKIVVESSMPPLEIEPHRYRDEPCESDYRLEYLIDDHVYVLHFPLSELKEIDGADVKKEILSRLHSTKKFEDHKNYASSCSRDQLRDNDGTSEMLSDIDTELGMEVFCVCRRGVDSILATQILQGAGIKSVYNVTGGLTAWSSTADPSFPMY